MSYGCDSQFTYVCLWQLLKASTSINNSVAIVTQAAYPWGLCMFVLKWLSYAAAAHTITIILFVLVSTHRASASMYTQTKNHTPSS